MVDIRRGPRIFVSYRRSDAGGHAGRLGSRLKEHYGADRVFQDVEGIRIGDDFSDALRTALADANVLLAVIGPDWVSARGTDGRRRLDDSTDWVRREVATALTTSKRVIPVLVGETSWPAETELPEDLRSLQKLQRVAVRSDRFEDDIRHLIRSIGGRGRRMLGLSPLGQSAALAMIGLLITGAWLQINRVKVMTGDFNVAVAPFTEVRGAQEEVVSTQSMAIAQTVYQGVASTFAELNRQSFSFEVRGPKETERIRGTTREERARAADATARTIDADVIIYGTISAGTLSPEFYVRSRNNHFKNAEEVTGQYEMARTFLGSQLEAGTGSLTDKKTLRDRLGARVQCLAQFVIGLSWYASENWTAATAAFKQALEKGDWRAGSGVEVIYVLLGNTAGKLKDLASSRAAFERALEINPAYARGHLGAAEVAFLRSNCEQGHPDETSLTEAEARYRESLTAGIRPAMSNIDAKAAFGLGRVHICMSQALLADRWADAVSEFQKVVAEFERGNSSIKELAGEAYGFLGFAARPSVGAANPGPDFCNAKSYYQKASNLAGNSERKAVFDKALSEIAQRLRAMGSSCS